MPLNLILDPWIPVTTPEGRRTITPGQMADPGVLRPDWPRADLNIAWLELLIGLVALADPPASPEEWEARRAADPARLQERLAALAPAFNLSGDGPLFLQDLEPLAGEANPPDMLFIDSAGGNAARNNADLMVWRGRYPALDPALAAMALYTLQSQAPAGGAGNRTSMRGGGPMVTLVEPFAGCSLWDLVWANVPCGPQQGLEALPWMRPTRVSDKDQEVWPPADVASPVEAFFGMPRRLRLVVEGDLVTGVVQRPYGTNYAGWQHPLTPYYRLKPGSELLPVHPRAGAFGYRNWLGVVAASEKTDLRAQAACVAAYSGRVRRSQAQAARVIVAGWAMDNMKPRDFVLSRQPLLDLPQAQLTAVQGMVEAAELLAGALRMALKPVLAEGSALEALREEFFARTQAPLEARIADLRRGEAVAGAWLADLRAAGLALFDAAALPGMDRRETDVMARIAQARQGLLADFAGRRKLGRAAFDKLGLTPQTRTEAA
ncbi:type I-E CRISPR-associated protein Cse1/CasA [Frigidibacter mobilis]|nr:type I-E CRISPR-associated protein Cse1/CasA [Frigidibacter mobilis]